MAENLTGNENEMNNQEISASELLKKLRRDLGEDVPAADNGIEASAEKGFSDIAEDNGNAPEATGVPQDSNDDFAQSFEGEAIEKDPKTDGELEQLIQKYLYNGDADAAAAHEVAQSDTIDIEAALDEILSEEPVVAGSESVRSEIHEDPQPEEPITAEEPEVPAEPQPLQAQTVFEDEETAGALDANIPLYPEFEAEEESGETGIGDDFRIPWVQKEAEPVKPAEPIAYTIPSIELESPATPSVMDELKRIQAEENGETPPKPEISPDFAIAEAEISDEITAQPEAGETEEEAQMRRFLSMYDHDDDVQAEATPEAIFSKAAVIQDANGEINIDAVPENWADMEAGEELLQGPDLNGDGKFDQTDLDLMAAFGVEESLKEAISDEQIDELKSELEQRNQRHLNEMEEGRTRGEFLLQNRAEYVSNAQNKEIFARYKIKYMKLLRRMGLGILCVLALFIIENYSLLHIQLPKFMNPTAYQTVYALLDFQFVLLSVALVWNSTWFSFKSMLHRKPMPESITGMMFLVSIVYTAAVCILAPFPKLYLFNLPVSICALLHQVYRYMRFRREIMSFKVVSSKKQKFVIDALPAKDASLEMEAFAEYIPDDPLMFKIRRASFIEGFYERMDTYPRCYRILGIVFPVAFLLAIAFFAAEFLLTHNLLDAMNAAYITLFACLPVMSYVSLSQPLYVASRIAYNRESAIIGESSLGEYANASIISFDDRDVFPADKVTVKNVKVFGNNRIDHVLYYTASVMHMMGGPLGDIFTTAAKEVGYSEDVQIRLIDDTGIEALVDGQTVVVGRSEFLSRYGYAIEETDHEKQMQFSHELAVMYLSYGDELAAKMYIDYQQDDGFEKILKQLYRQGMCVAIKTYDPNIDDALLASKINIAKYPVKIIKCHREETPTTDTNDKISTGVVSKSSAKNLLHTLSLCDKISGVLKFNSLLKIICTIAAMFGMAAIVLLGYSLQIPSIWVVLYQLIWLIPVIIVGRIRIN